VWGHLFGGRGSRSRGLECKVNRREKVPMVKTQKKCGTALGGEGQKGNSANWWATNPEKANAKTGERGGGFLTEDNIGW